MMLILRNRNVLVISMTSAAITFFQQIYNPFWSLYLRNLGFSIPEIGILTAIRSSEEFLFQLPGGILADRIGRKKVTLIIAFIRIFTPILFFFSTKWEHVLFASVLVGLESIQGPAFNAIVAESLPREQIGVGYGFYNTIQRIPSIFTGVIGGILMDTMGIEAGTKICFIGASIMAVIVLICRYFFLTETLVARPNQNSNILGEVTEVIPLFKGTLRGMLVASTITQFAAGLTSSYIVIYVVNIIGLSKTEWGIVSSVMSILSLLTAIPGGMICDKVDKRKLLTLARSIEPITIFGYLTFNNFWQILSVRMIAGIGMGLSGSSVYGMLGGPAWSSLLADIVPTEKRGRVSGLMGTISGLSALFSPYIGAYAWESESIGPHNTLILSALIGVSSSVIIWFFVKDPRFKGDGSKH